MWKILCLETWIQAKDVQSIVIQIQVPFTCMQTVSVESAIIAKI